VPWRQPDGIEAWLHAAKRFRHRMDSQQR